MHVWLGLFIRHKGISEANTRSTVVTNRQARTALMVAKLKKKSGQNVVEAVVFRVVFIKISVKAILSW